MEIDLTLVYHYRKCVLRHNQIKVLRLIFNHPSLHVSLFIVCLNQFSIIIFFNLSGVAAAMTFITALASVTYMAVPDALCIVFSCPVVTIILSAIILKDRLTVAKVCS